MRSGLERTVNSDGIVILLSFDQVVAKLSPKPWEKAFWRLGAGVLNFANLRL